ncbi:MAG: hypothetical protein H6817_00480 [Phycisphaerales bacterium]|nr:hypothetical protein [Phycisphaerales bacterium]
MSHARHECPKVYELARQLGVTPHALIAIARTLDIPVQNRLTRLQPHLAKRLAEHCATLATGDKPKNDRPPQSPIAEE